MNRSVTAVLLISILTARVIALRAQLSIPLSVVIRMNTANATNVTQVLGVISNVPVVVIAALAYVIVEQMAGMVTTASCPAVLGIARVMARALMV